MLGLSSAMRSRRGAIFALPDNALATTSTAGPEDSLAIKGILKNVCSTDQDTFRLNMQLLVRIVKNERRLTEETRVRYERLGIRNSAVPPIPQLDILGDRDEFAKCMWGIAYTHEEARDAIHSQYAVESTEDLDHILQREEELMTNASKELYVIAMRIAELVPASFLPDSHRSPKSKSVRLTLYRRDGTPISKPVRPTSDVSDLSEPTVLIPGKISEQDPDFKPPISHRIRMDYCAAKTKYPIPEPALSPGNSASPAPVYKMNTVKGRTEQLLQRQSSKEALSRISIRDAAAFMHHLSLPVSSYRDAWRYESPDPRRLLTESQLQYPPKASPDFWSVWRMFTSQVVVSEWLEQLIDRSMES